MSTRYIPGARRIATEIPPPRPGDVPQSWVVEDRIPSDVRAFAKRQVRGFGKQLNLGDGAVRRAGGVEGGRDVPRCGPRHLRDHQRAIGRLTPAAA